MSAESPPIYYFTNINFNSSFYDPANTGLTQTQANALYLRKTTPDTASAIETFAGGVLTDTINSITAGSNMAIASNHAGEDLFLAQNITSGDIYIGVNASATTGRSGTIHIGDGNNLTGGIIHINNGTTNASNTNINNGTTTTGTVNIMTGNTSTGTINLATGSGSAKVNIGSGTSTGLITLGNTANIVSFNCPPALSYNPSLIGSTQLGYNGLVPASITNIVGLTDSPVMSIVLPIGIWLLQAQIIFNLTANGPIYAAISSTTPLIDNACCSSTTAVVTAYSFISLQRTVRITTSSPPISYYLTCRAITTATTLFAKTLEATRIG